MRARTSIQWGIAGMVGLWTCMLLFVILTLFVRAPEIQSTVEQVDDMIAPSTDILLELARHHSAGDTFSQQKVQNALDRLNKNPRYEYVSPTQLTVVGEGQRWLDEDVDDASVFRLATLALAEEAHQELMTIHQTKNKVYLTIFLACLALLNALFLIRYLVLRLIDPLEEVFHYMESRKPIAEMPRYHVIPAVRELSVIQEVLQAFVDERHAYVRALHQHVPFGDQQAVEILLERIKRPVWVIDPEGDILAANDAAIDVLASPDGPNVRDQLYRFTPFFAANHDNAETDAMVVPTGWILNIATDGEAMLCLHQDLLQGAV